jgi:hypothetical protein
MQITDKKDKIQSPPTLRPSNKRYPRASRPVVIQHNTPQTAERHRLAASHACTPVAATGITISPGPAQPSNRVQKASTYRILDACFGTRPSLPYLRYTCTLDPDPHWRSIPTVDAVLFLPGLSCCCSTTKEKKKRGRGSMMCDYTQVEYACGHLRFTVRAWCKWSGITDALLKLDADRSSLQASSIRNRTSDVLQTSSLSSTD